MVIPGPHRFQPAKFQSPPHTLQTVGAEGIVLVEDCDATYPQVLGQARDHLLRFLVIRSAEIDHVVQTRVAQELRPGERGKKRYAGFVGQGA